MRAPEEELLSELDAHDALVTRCARGELTWEEFERAYDSFYPRYPLDGHESDADELRLFEKYASRIALHHELWEQVLTKVTADEHLREPSAANAGFIGTAEAVRRMRTSTRSTSAMNSNPRPSRCDSYQPADSSNSVCATASTRKYFTACANGQHRRRRERERPILRANSSDSCRSAHRRRAA